MVNVLIVGSNSYMAAQMSRELSVYNDISGVRAAACAQSAEALITEQPPGVLVIESGAADVECMSGLWEKTGMRVILIAETMTDEAIYRAVRSGVSYCMVKPVSAALLHDRVRMAAASCTVKQPKLDRPPREETLREIDRLLDGFGLRPNCTGYSYLRYGVMIAVKKEDTDRLMLTKDVYPRVARQFSTTRACVERAMRSCIKAAWENRHNGPTQMPRFAQRPCNGLFIATLARMVLYGEDWTGGLGD